MKSAMDLIAVVKKIVANCESSVAFGAPEMHGLYLDRMVTDLNDLFIEAQGGKENATVTLAAAKAAPESKASEITEGLVEMLRSRDAHRQKRYGTTLDRGDLSFDQWMQRLPEELLDGANYIIQCARRERRLADFFRSGESRDPPSPAASSSFATCHDGKCPKVWEGAPHFPPGHPEHPNGWGPFAR